MPQCSIQNCTDLISCLNNSVQGTAGSQFIELKADLFNAAGELAQYLLLSSFTVKQRDAATPLIQPKSPCVSIVGNAVLFPSGPSPQIEYEVEISAEVVGSGVVLVLKATPVNAGAWSLAANFSSFPDYYGYTKAALVWLPTFYTDMVVTQPAFWVATTAQSDHPKGLSFTGFADLTKGSLASVGSYFPQSNQVPLHGPITLRQGKYPKLDLTGDLKNYSIDKLAELSLHFGTIDAAGNSRAESTLLLVGSTTIGSLPAINMSAPILQGSFAWVITGEIANKEQYSLSSILSLLIAYAGGHALPLPTGMDTGGLYLDTVVVSIEPKLPPTIDMIGFRIASSPNKVWSAPILGLAISDLFVEWQIVSPFSKPSLIGAVGGTLRLGTGDTAPRLLIEVGLSGINTQTAPDVEITAQLDPQYPVPIAALFQQFTGIEIDLNLVLSRLLLEAGTGTRRLQFSATLDGEWPFPVPLVTFGQTTFFFLYTPNNISGSVSVRVSIASFDFLVSAAYAGKGQGWQFEGQLAPDTQGRTLQDFVNSVTDNKYPNLPANLGAISLQQFAVSFNTKSGAFAFDAALEWPFKFDGFFDLTIAAELSLKSPGPSPTGRKYSGFVSGKISINAFSISVVYTFDVEDNRTLTFVIKYNTISLTCAFSKDPKTGNRLLKANLGGVTFGGIVEYLVNLVDPNLGFKLSSPWDILNEISFDNLILTVNLTTKEVGISYKLDKDLGIVYINTIGLAYVDKAGRKTVDIKITGRFFDQNYPETSPLSWDLLNDPPPTPPGKGDQLLDLRYLGIGQNVGFRDTHDFKTVQDVMKVMESDFLPVDSQDANPLTSPALAKLKFAGDGRWLIGADFTLMGAVSLTVIFNDPSLYGLRIALSGEKVKSFSGLDFQILYKKVTDTIGVYHIELTLPEAFRQLQFGAVAITLPIITIDIYTNGNFRLDFGFPVGLDFSRSFCVQAGPFIGYGGFYFALLDGATSERVPKITNGTFSPVIEAGLALSVGLGRTFDKGVLSAGISITLQAIIEGAFGWFNPNDRSAGTALYYWIQGTARIVGKLYGSVNFVIIQAEVKATAYASVTLTIESYKPILVKLEVGVEISVSVKILFFRITFSFSATLEFSFTIGHASPTPWIVDGSQPSALALRQQVDPLSRRRLSGAVLQRAMLDVIGAGGTFDWTPRAVFGEIQQVGLSLVPALTVALPDQVFATHQALGATGHPPQLQVVVSLFAPNSVPPEARLAKEVRAVNIPDAEKTPFNLLVSGMLSWALSSYTRQPALPVPPPVDFALATDLEAIADFLNDPSKWQSVFTYDALAAMMELNYKLRITTPLGPSGMMHPNGQLLEGAGATAPEVTATVFPMIPDLEMTPKGQQPVQFWNYGCITRDYEDALSDYYKQLQVNSGATGGPVQASGPVGQVSPQFRSAQGPVGCTGGESLSTFIFRDYFAMVTKGAVSSASDLLKAYPYKPSGALGPSAMTGPTGPPESLKSIAQEFSGLSFNYLTRSGDTIGTVAGRFGVSPASLQENNPHLTAQNHQDKLPQGVSLAIDSGVTPAAIAAANQNYPLHFEYSHPVRMSISGVKHQVKGATGGRSESLGAISNQFDIPDVASIFTFLAPTTPPGNPNTNSTNLLQPGAQMTIPSQTFKVISPLDDIPALVASFFFVRGIGPAQPQHDVWYSSVQYVQQWILDNNQDLTQPVWTVPIVALQSDGSLKVTGTQQYAVQGTEDGALLADTLDRVSGYFVMKELAPPPYTQAFHQFQNIVSKTGPPQTYAIGSFPYMVQSGDTFDGVARLFGVGIERLAVANAAISGLLQTLAVLALPTIEYPIAQGDTLASVAASFDLTLNDLADSVQYDAGILQPYTRSKETLIIPDVPGRPVDKLLADLVTFGRFNDISGMLSRFLLHGMRVPQPDIETGKVFPPDVPLWGLYEMSGQQFPVPSGATGPSGNFEMTFKQGASASWICLATGPTGCAEELVVPLRPGFFSNAPSMTLHPEIVAGPGALPLYQDTPRQYSMQQSIHWQAATTIPLPGPTAGAQAQAGQPSIWTFPRTLLNIAEQGPPGPTSSLPQYELVVASPTDPTGDSDLPVPHYCWASAIDVRIQRAPAVSSNKFMPNGYVLLGADQEGRDQLLAAWTYMQELRPPYGSLHILYPPSATSDNSNGLASVSLNPAQTFLLKSNLTTVTQSNQAALTAGLPQQPSGDYYARLEAIPDFLRLVWEASITGSGGFYLNYVSANGGGGLPETLFANGDVATITLVLLAGPQEQPYRTDHGLYPFNNCAIVGDNFDPASSRLYVRATSPKRADLIRIANVTAGNVGFYMARINPDPGGTGSLGPTGPDDQTRNLYNLAGFQVADNPYFSESNQGLPASPTDTPVAGVSGPTGPHVWWYQQILPVYKFGKTNNSPSSAALPPAEQNPYAGITGPTGATGSASLSKVSIDLALYDVYGNKTFCAEPVGPVTAVVGYTDELIGISSWPGVGADFSFLKGPSASVILDTQVSMQIVKYIPSGSYGYDQSSAAAQADASRYNQLFYQVQQLDLGFALETNLGNALLAPDALKAPMTAFVSKAKVFTDAAASLQQQKHITQGGDRLGEIAAAYNITVGALVAENSGQTVKPLFKGKVVQPIFAVAGPSNTLTLLVAGQVATPFPPDCDSPGATACPDSMTMSGSLSVSSPGEARSMPSESSELLDLLLSPSELATNNRMAPLTPGIDLRTEPRISSLPKDAPNTLAGVAAVLQCAVYALVKNPDGGSMIEIGLFHDNYTSPNIVKPNLEIEIDGLKVSTGDNPTFQSVQNAFSSLGLSTGDFVVKLQGVAGIFAPTAQLAHADFIVPPPPPSKTGPSLPIFSLKDMPTGTGSIDFLATQNREVENFYYAGTSIYLRYCCYTPQPFDTFAILAQQFHHITLDQLAQFNATALLNEGVELRIPNLTYLGDPAKAYAPYAPTASDSLSSIAVKFGATVNTIATLNRYLPGIFNDTVSITIGTKITPKPLDSLQSMADKFSLPFDQFISDIAEQPGLFRSNGTVITPLPVVPDAGSGESPAIDSLAQQFNIHSQAGPQTSAAPMLAANRCLEKFLRDGALIAGPTGSQPVPVGPHDTLDTVIRKFSVDQKIEVTIDQLAVANGLTTNLLTVGRAFLLPPNPTSIDSPVNPKIPPQGVGCESQIVFPVKVAVTMTRSRGLVAPDFANTAAVYTNTTSYTPRGWTQDATSLNLAAFAESFEDAFAAYRLKCAVAKRDAVSDPKQAGQLMAVNFGPSGVSLLEVESSTPQFYALAPLSTKLLSGTLPIRTYKSGCGLCSPTPKTFDSVDLDSWMLQFLSTIDLFLSNAYSIPAFQLNRSGPTGQAPSFDDLTGASSEQTGPVGLVDQNIPNVFSLAELGQTGGTGCFGCTGGTGMDGPGNYDDIVASKLLIAQQLKKDVMPILNGVGATGGYYAQMAQETLYQQMLVKLSDAYNINAIVQYPVSIHSPCVTPPEPSGPTASIPPRVSGKIVPDLYVSASGSGTLSDAAVHFGVSTPFLAETIGDVQGLLRDEVTVEFESQPPYKIGPTDTINRVAEHFGVEADPNAPGYWETWTPFAEALGSQPILVSGGSFPVVKTARQVYQRDTIGSIADYFAVDSGTLGEANQQREGIFVVGQSINLSGYQPYVVKAQDTLSKIARAIQPKAVNPESADTESASPALTVSTLSRLIADQQNLLVVGETLYLTQILPDVTMSTTKISLGHIGSQQGPDPALSFLFSVKHPKQYKNLFLNLKYVINELEFDISNVAGTSGYQASSWLTFLLPIGSGLGSDVGVETGMQQVQIPIPLRSYPIPPSVEAQSGLPTPQQEPPKTPEEAIAQGKQWDYRVDFQSLSAAQDTDHVQVTFNTFGEDGFNSFTIKRTDLVFRALAEFIDAYPQLTTDLAILPKLLPGEYNERAAVAVRVLDTLAANVAWALSASMTAEITGTPWPEQKYLYRLQTLTANRQLKELQLGLQAGPSGNAPIWPEVFIKSVTAPTAGTGPDAGFLKLERTSTTGATADFQYPPGFQVGTLNTQRFVFPARDVIQNQDASGGIYVTRNDDLVASGPLGTYSPTGPTGPRGAISTNSAFVYQTSLVSFIDSVTPFLVDSTAINVADLTGPTGHRALALHIKNMLNSVLEWGPQSLVKANINLSILCSYGFAVSGMDTSEDLIATTPIRLVPTQLLTPEGEWAFANQLADSIQSWPGWPGSNETGVLILDVSLFTTPPGMTSQDLTLKPIMEFENLRVPISKIGDDNP